MAPKAAAAAAAAKPPPKDETPKDEEKEKYILLKDLNPFKTVSMIMWYFILGVLSVLSIACIAVSLKFYSKFKKVDLLRVDEGLRKLKPAVAFAIMNPNMVYKSHTDMARSYLLLQHHKNNRPDKLMDEKRRYKSFFEGPAELKMAWRGFGTDDYYISKEAKTWYEAENFCMARGSHLASILTIEDQNYITIKIREPFWIGLINEDMENDWKWTDGSSLEFQRWSPKSKVSLRHNTMEQDCTFLDPLDIGHNWKIDDCIALKRFICKEVRNSK